MGRLMDGRTSVSHLTQQLKYMYFKHLVNLISKMEEITDQIVNIADNSQNAQMYKLTIVCTCSKNIIAPCMLQDK